MVGYCLLIALSITLHISKATALLEPFVIQEKDKTQSKNDTEGKHIMDLNPILSLQLALCFRYIGFYQFGRVCMFALYQQNGA